MTPPPAPASRGTVGALFRSLRPKQFIKNLLVFAPAIFIGPGSHGSANRWLLTPGVFEEVLLTFALLSLLVGCTYIINDYIDLESDRTNPAKRRRPMAAGELSPRLALAFALLTIPLVLAVVTLWRWQVGAAFAVYLVVTLTYSFALKRIVIVDIMTIAGLFVLRAYVGALVLDAPLSIWFLACVGSLALFVATCKRHHELRMIRDGALAQATARPVINDYNNEFVLMIMAISTMGALMTYTFFAIEEAPRGFGLTIPMVIFGLLRFNYLALVRGVGGTPEVTLLRDAPLLVDMVLWTGLLIYIYSLGS